MKSLLPSLKEKKRYIVFEVVRSTNSSNVSASIMNSAAGLLGELVMAKSNMKFMNDKWDASTKKGVLRVNRKYVEHAKAAMALADDHIIRTLGVSGTLKKATSKFMR